MTQPPTPESGERFRIISRNEVAGAALGAAAGGAANVIVTIYVNPEGITGDQKQALLDRAQDRLDSAEQVGRIAGKSSDPDAPAAERFSNQVAGKTRQKIVGISERDTIDSTKDHVDGLLGWPALVGAGVGLAVTHGARRARFAWRHRRSKP